ncbi:hypothetical protein KI688_007552 [Linnemannia hyalina]|uniref:F-box domain-containing protein n=1 Tax=Linnemannia hyalina TaxID=64524 RepID=A0A9P7XJQ1_9FUNG|nr:hypothetical protein KI688_007552 [Linnemannia hyalina]
MTSLPPELLKEIARHLSRHELTVSVRVCQEWHAAINQSLWEKVLLDSSRDRDSRFESFKKCVVEAGALSRSGYWIRVLRAYHYEAASLLTTYGATTCTEIARLTLGSKSDGVVDNYDAMRLLEQSTKLKGLHLSGQMIAPTNPKYEQLIAAVPTTVEVLFLGDMGHDSEQHFDSDNGDDHDGAASPPQCPQPLIPLLPRLTNLGILGLAVNNATWPLIFKNCPGLKALRLDWNNGKEGVKAIASAAREHCPALNQLRLLNMTADLSRSSFDEVWATFLSSSTCGWEALEIDAASNVVSVGPLSMAALLPRLPLNQHLNQPLHASTLKTLGLGYGADISSEYVRQLYEAAPNLTITVNYEAVPRSIDPAK